MVESLRAQVDLAPTPKQRIALQERIGLLLEEEFLDHAQAVVCFEDIIGTDPGHEGANSALARLTATSRASRTWSRRSTATRPS